MCGRFTLTQPADAIAQHFNLGQVPLFEPRYNVAPTQAVAVVRADLQQERQLHWLQWGLVPSWSKDPKMGARMINARAETLAEKPSFRQAFRRRRCLIPADGFYEWHRSGKAKQPYYFFLDAPAETPTLFAFAGLWEHWENGNGDVIESCTIITTEPNETLQAFHDRMPVILPPSTYDRWLDPTEQTEHLQSLLQPYAASTMGYYPVSTTVNNPRQADRSCIQPLERSPLTP
ncbi:MAG: SOS response-associated peptidase [Leptolyngbyaceae cyanobacterium SL_7_1]|nr:SOS response-associated peptidase [Leptolyngbyaceae cyanobacterium SL_7_1]